MYLDPQEPVGLEKGDNREASRQEAGTDHPFGVEGDGVGHHI